MNSGFYAAFTGYEARIDALDVLANNLANANTNGFKAQHTFYRTFADWLEPGSGSAMNLAANKYGVLGGTRLDLSQGHIDPDRERHRRGAARNGIICGADRRGRAVHTGTEAFPRSIRIASWSRSPAMRS